MSSRNNLERGSFILFLAASILPMALSLLYALGYSVGLAGLLSDGFTLEYWGRLGESGEIWRSFGLSIAVALAVIAADLALALPLGIALRGRLRSGALSYLIYLPLALPGAVLAFLAFQFLSGAGYLSRVMAALGIIGDPSGFPSLVNDQHGIAIIAAQLVVGVPFFTILFTQLHHGERVGELTALARTLGAGRWQSLARVAAPVLLGRAFPTVVLYFVGVLGAYEVPLLLGAQSPQMISVLTMRKYAMFDLTQKPEAFICAILYTCVTAALIAVAYRRSHRDEH